MEPSSFQPEKVTKRRGWVSLIGPAWFTVEMVARFRAMDKLKSIAYQPPIKSNQLLVQIGRM